MGAVQMDRADRGERVMAATCSLLLAGAVALAGPLAAQHDSVIRVHSPGVTGDLRLHPFVSRIYGNSRMLRVLLPAGYDAPANRSRRYPVLYLADGQNLFDSTTSVFAPREWHVDEIAQELIAAGKIPPMIMVGVDDAGRVARAHEYLPYPDTAAKSTPGYDATPEGKRYPDFMIDEVIPFINARYRTLRDPDHTGIGGSSYGALISTYVVAVRPGVFGRLLSESSTYRVFDYADARNVRNWPGRVYLGVGTNEDSRPGCQAGPVPTLADSVRANLDDMVMGVLHMADYLRSAGLDSTRLRLVVAPCGTHTAGAWAARLPEALTFLFGKRR